MHNLVELGDLEVMCAVENLVGVDIGNEVGTASALCGTTDIWPLKDTTYHKPMQQTNPINNARTEWEQDCTEDVDLLELLILKSAGDQFGFFVH